MRLSSYQGELDLPTETPGRVRCLVTDSQRVLVTWDARGPKCLPGGGAKPGETLVETARRAVWEETIARSRRPVHDEGLHGERGGCGGPLGRVSIPDERSDLGRGAVAGRSDETPRRIAATGCSQHGHGRACECHGLARAIVITPARSPWRATSWRWNTIEIFSQRTWRRLRPPTRWSGGATAGQPGGVRSRGGRCEKGSPSVAGLSQLDG